MDASGVVVDTAPSGGCAHATGADGANFGATVQLFPYADTPDGGGVYKVWVTRTADLNCATDGNRNCFVPVDSKVDNFTLRSSRVAEIDVRFWKNGAAQDGYAAAWTDTNGAHNIKYSEWNPEEPALHEAHFDATEQGTHSIRVASQPGCDIASVKAPDGSAAKLKGAKATVPVTVADHAGGNDSYGVDVTCK